MRKTTRHVNSVKRTLSDGSKQTYYYHRATGIRLPDDQKSVAFTIALERANGQATDTAVIAPDPTNGRAADTTIVAFEPTNGHSTDAEIGVETISTLIRAYKASNDWRKLAKSTKEIGQFDLNAIEDRWGDLPLSALSVRGTRAKFLEWHDEMAEKTPKAADAKMTRLARVLSFGVDREKITVNPIATFKRAYKSDRSDNLWLPDYLAALNAVAPPHLRMVVFFALHTAQRRGDLLALEWSAYDGAGLSVTQGKTRAKVYIPCTVALKVALDDMKAEAIRGAVARGKPASTIPTHILLNSKGQPWTSAAFHTAWDRAFNAAFPEFREIKGKAVKVDPPPPDLHFHDLRGTAITMLAEAGCTVPEIATITGHSLATVTRILERYLSRTQTLAQSAIAKLNKKMTG